MLTGRRLGGSLVTSVPAIRTTPAGRFDESADHVQRRRLAATRRPEQTEELAVPDVQVERVQRDRVAVTLLDATQFDRIAVLCNTSRRIRREFVYRDTSQRSPPFGSVHWSGLP